MKFRFTAFTVIAAILILPVFSPGFSIAAFAAGKTQPGGKMKMPTMEEMMEGMPPDYEKFINEGINNTVGVMILSHGGWEIWDKKVTDAVKKYPVSYPTVICFGMAMMHADHVQKGLNDLERSGVQKIIVVPLFVGKYNEVANHYRYLFGLAKTSLWPKVKKVHPKAEIIYQPEVSPLDPLIQEIMTDYARELSTNPKNERVLIIGHGPFAIEYNRDQEIDLNKMGQAIKKAGGFKEVMAKNLQDDNYTLRPKNVKELRDTVTQWGQNGDVLVLSFLMSSSDLGIQPKIKRDLKGLKFKFNPKGLSEHKNFALWIKKSIDAGVAK